MTPRDFGLCIRCRTRRSGRPDRLCHFCRRTVNWRPAQAKRDAEAARLRRKRHAEKAAKPLYFTPPR